MPKIREYSQEETFKLDECFKETLARVKPYILALTCAESAQLCKIWLNKLHDASSQRRLRNSYLIELYKQLKTGHVGGIFNTLPPHGSLLPLPKSYHMVCISSSVSDLSDYVMRPHRSSIKPNPKCIEHQRNKTLLKHRMMDIANMNQCLHAMNPLTTIRLHDQSTVKKRIEQKFIEQAINIPSTIIAELQDQNEYLWNQFAEYPRNRNKNVDDYVSASISHLTTDVTTLKAKLTEMQKLKHSLVESNKEAVREYHGTVLEQFSELKRQLADAQLKNEALDKSVAEMTKKLEEIINGKVRGRNFACKTVCKRCTLKDEEAKVMEQQWMDKVRTMCERFDSFTREKNKELQLKQELLDKRDTESSKKDAERKKEIEALTNKIRGLEMKLEMKEDKLQTTLVEQYANMKEEFSKMRTEIDQETQTQNQILMSKVSALKKAVLKLEKSKEKLEYEYERKLSHTIKNKNMEIKALQLQLHEQKNELCTSLSTKKQSEVDSIVSILEKRYKTLLAETEAMSESQAQEYFRKIAILEEQILNLKKL